ncbi:MAG: Hsp20/alpha crystallin family protein [Pseudobacter sp.]|uniref:Hsp20/alpha crystallin family protein n=1 Tax=Pseudobacter sp. TaxID=2045420 RepID=UPI003F7CEA42
MSEFKCLLVVIVCVTFLHAMGRKPVNVTPAGQPLQILPVMDNVIKSAVPEHSFVKTFCGMFSDMDHLEDELHADRKTVAAPATNIYETDTVYCIEVALPGYQRADIKLKREDDLITVCADSQTIRHKNLQRFFRQEFTPCSFTRSFLLPDDAGEANASFADGVLSIKLDKRNQWMAGQTVVQAISIQ